MLQFSIIHLEMEMRDRLKNLFTSESVTEGHPDKICDQISDAVLDACLAQDPLSRVACETATKTGFIILLGEITTKAQISYEDLVRGVITDIGYDSDKKGFNGETAGILLSLSRQSEDIAQGVNRSLETRIGSVADSDIDTIGAGDQGMMFGYACNETSALMPMPIFLAHKLAHRLAEVRKNGSLPWLRPDGKTQVTVEYSQGRPVRIDTVLISAQHAAEISQDAIRESLIEQVIMPVLPPELVDKTMTIHTNPTGRFVIGGPYGDAGLTGRKIIVDTYGGMGRHGGGAFSGKDPTKVDRSAAYAARWVAKNIIAAGLADRCEIQVAYAIGMSHPVSVKVETFNTGRISDDQITALVLDHFDLRPGAIIRDLALRRPLYRQVAAYGHFGREDLALPWEQTDRAGALTSAAKLAME